MSALLQQMRQDSPWGLYPMDEASGATMYDRSGNGRNGSYVGSPTLRAAGPAGLPAVQFDGSSQTATIAANLSALSAVTVEAWVRPSGFRADYDMIWELTSDGLSNTGGIINYFKTSTTEIEHGHRGGDIQARAYTRPALDTWVHLVASHDYAAAPEIAFYRNGVFESGTQTGGYDNTPGTTFANSTFYLMSRASSSLWAAGRMACFAIYPSVLAADRVLSHYRAGIRSGVVVG